MKIVLQLTHAQVKNAALAQAGIAGKAFGMRPGSRVHKNKKSMQERGQVKHRARALD